MADDRDALVRIRVSDWLKLVSGELEPTDSARLGLTELHGTIPPCHLRAVRW